MPIYCYRNGQDVLDKVFLAGHAPKVIYEHGKAYERSFSDEHCGVSATHGWPMECWASGVQPQDAQKLRDYFAKAGVPTEVTDRGNPIYRNPAHRRAALKCRGFRDNDSFV